MEMKAESTEPENLKVRDSWVSVKTRLVLLCWWGPTSSYATPLGASASNMKSSQRENGEKKVHGHPLFLLFCLCACALVLFYCVCIHCFLITTLGYWKWGNSYCKTVATEEGYKSEWMSRWRRLTWTFHCRQWNSSTLGSLLWASRHCTTSSWKWSRYTHVQIQEYKSI